MSDLSDRPWHLECPPIIGMLRLLGPIQSNPEETFAHTYLEVVEVGKESLQEISKVLEHDVRTYLQTNRVATWIVHIFGIRPMRRK